MKIGEEFNEIISKNVLREISNATTSLSADLIYLYPEEALELIELYVGEAKRIVNCYLNEQRTTLLKLNGLEEQSQNSPESNINDITDKIEKCLRDAVNPY